MNYTHLTIEERCCLREYYLKGYSYRKIPELIGRNVSTVSRELKRNRTHMYDIPTYYPYTAQKKGRNLSRVSPTTLKKNLALINARPKKVLGFKKPVDLFEFSLSKCCT